MHKKLSPFDQLCQPETLLAAWKPVRTGRTAAGLDQMTLAEYARELEANIAALAVRLREGRYYPLPVRTVEIRKANGGVRQLGIYTIEDSIVQRAAKDVLEPLFEPSFLPCSCGFRPGRGVPTAVKQVLDYRAAGDLYLVDADITDCFGSLNHGLLMQLFAARIRDKRFQQLVRLWLDTGKVLPKPGQQAEAGLSDRVTEWLSDSLSDSIDGAVSHLLHDRVGGYGYGYTATESYDAPLPAESPDELRKQARKQALKQVGGAGLMWALTHAGRVRNLMSPTALALTGAAVLTAAAAPVVTRAARRYFNGEPDRLSGIVQGGAISPLLCNLYLHEFDAALTRAGLHLVRYADDFVIGCRDEASARQALELAAQKLAEWRLRLHPQKTRVVRFDEGLEFLGYRFAQFDNTATPISPKDTGPIVTVLAQARAAVAPPVARLGEQVQERAAQLKARLKEKLAARRQGGAR